MPWIRPHKDGPLVTMRCRFRRLYTAACLICGLTATICTLWADANPEQELPAPIYTRQVAFAIPFRVKNSDSKGKQAQEIQLHVSRDHGATWKKHATVKPTAGKFSFKDAVDGEYLFMVKTLDANGKLLPDRPAAAEMRVIVDTQLPDLELELNAGTADEVVATWRGEDANLRLDSFRIEYRTDLKSDRWETLSSTLPRNQSDDGTYEGRATWKVPQGKTKVEVRAEIRDASGNRAVENREIDLSTAEKGPPVAEQKETAPSDQAPRKHAEALASKKNSDDSTPGKASSDEGTERRAKIPSEMRKWRAHEENLAKGERGESQPAGSPLPANSPNQRTQAKSGDSHNSGGHQSLEPNAPSQAAGDSSKLPQGLDPHRVNSRSFELEYEIVSIGASGVGKVEIWSTLDGGRTWTRFGEGDPNLKSVTVELEKLLAHLQVSVRKEGLFGFKVVVESKNGSRGEAPRSGDAPDIWVQVDLTKPKGALVSAEQFSNSSGQPESLQIRWEASDDMLGSRPIALLMSESSEGPWSLIQSGLENTGTYDWKLGDRVPSRIFLRLTIRDLAGNEQTITAQEPVVLEQIKPAGRVRGVRSLDDADSAARRIFNLR